MDAPWYGKCDFEKFRATLSIDVKTAAGFYNVISNYDKKNSITHQNRIETEDVDLYGCKLHVIKLNMIRSQNSIRFFIKDVTYYV